VDVIFGPSGQLPGAADGSAQVSRVSRPGLLQAGTVLGEDVLSAEINPFELM
jgi:hypothetical protein